jgi:hypothetical protein
MKCVEDLQNKSLFGSASTSFRIVDPVVVYPDTLSNQALMIVNSPPHMIYGSIPNTKDNSQARMMVTNPSLSDIWGADLTKMKGNAPTKAVRTQLIRRGVKPESIP